MATGKLAHNFKPACLDVTRPFQPAHCLDADLRGWCFAAAASSAAPAGPANFESVTNRRQENIHQPTTVCSCSDDRAPIFHE